MRSLRSELLKQRGFAALTVVMVLFFIMAMVAAYFNRTIILEQRMGTMAYRTMRAVEAADAGLDWTLALLNTGRLDTSCNPSSSGSDEELRTRFFNISSDGAYQPRPGLASVKIGCVVDGTTRYCICPTLADSSSGGRTGWPSHGGTAGFRVGIYEWRPRTTVEPGVLQLRSNGCGIGGYGASACTANTLDTPAVPTDGVARHQLFVGLLRNLPLVPPAALSIGTTLSSGGNQVTVVNADPQTGITVHAGSALAANPLHVFQPPAGATGDGRLSGDGALAALVPTAAQAWTPNDAFFRAMFQLQAPAYRDQPGVIKLACAGAGGCAATDLVPVIQAFPQRAVWVDGDLVLDAGTPAALGSDAEPLMLIVKGTLRVNAGVTIKGFVYAERIDWAAGAGGALIDGAVVTVRDFAAASDVRVVYDAALLQRIHVRYGSWIPMPNGWTNQ